MCLIPCFSAKIRYFGCMQCGEELIAILYNTFLLGVIAQGELDTVVHLPLQAQSIEEVLYLRRSVGA